MEKPFVVLDLEVTDLYESHGEIMGINALLVSPQGDCLSQLEILVQTQHDVPDWLLKALQLTPQVFAHSALTSEIALRKFLAFVGDHAVFIHNAPFDLPFIHHIASEFGVAFTNKVLDTLPIAELTWPGQRCSVDSLRELLEIGPRDNTENAANSTLQILNAARVIAESYHAQRIEAEQALQKDIGCSDASTGQDICPFCETNHYFQHRQNGGDC
jgi:DNA polymerase III alpha subunit (gram-positive type)